MQFQMKVWGLACASIAAYRDELPPGNRAIQRPEPDIGHIGLMCILPTPQQPCDAWGERLQMAIHTCIAIRMRYVKSVAKARQAHSNPADISIRNCKQAFAFYPTGLYVYSTMKVVRARFAKVSGQGDIIIHRRRVRKPDCKQQACNGIQHALKLMSSPLTE